MEARRQAGNISQVLDEMLGYLNFSSGASDPKFLGNFSQLFAHLEADERDESAERARQALAARLDVLASKGGAFSDSDQARAVLELVFGRLLPAYREFHRDLLFHQPDSALWRPFFLGRAAESVLQEGSPWSDGERIVPAAIARLNNFIGHRPVAVLRTAQRIEPYRHEWVAPIPLFVRGAGVAAGRYQALIERMLALLETTDRGVLDAAYFDPDVFDELALDPRAYDFDHPVNKRPNYHFGQWDPHHLDNQGRYRRFVLQQVTLDALLERVGAPDAVGRDELLYEAAAVLAGTTLMASGTSGSGPDTYDSGASLATIVPRIAAYRDVFYKQLLDRLPAAHGERLREEAASGRQPFAAARQHLNHYLARRRAAQLEHVHLAMLFARMGYPDAARRQAQVVPVASARMTSEIQCRLTTGHRAIARGELEQAAALLAEIRDFIERAVHCGALVDPWNILGFQGQFSLFPSPENSAPDHRVEQLIGLVEQTVGLYSRLWSEAASIDNGALSGQVDQELRELARWWDPFASTAVESVQSFSAAEAYDSAGKVAKALRAWHRAGAATADIGFWRKHVLDFNGPKAYALVAEALLEKRDFVAARALLIEWLGRADEIGLKQGEHSFHRLAARWLTAVSADTLLPAQTRSIAPGERRDLVVKFFDYLEANAEDFWEVPRLELQSSAGREAGEQVDDETEEDDEANLYGEAYDDVVYVDSTSDGVEGDMLESGAATDYELELEARRLHERLAFLATVAHLWKTAARGRSSSDPGAVPDEVLTRWHGQARQNHAGLMELLDTVGRQTIPAPTASRDSLLEFDRRTSVKDALVENIIAAATTTGEAVRVLAAIADEPGSAANQPIDRVFRAAVRSDPASVQEHWQPFVAAVRGHALLYVPHTRGGDPRKVAQVRGTQQMIRELLATLPRLGLFRETCQLIEAARLAETEHPLRGGAVSEFDRQFDTGYRSLVEALETASVEWNDASVSKDSEDSELVDALEQMTQSLLKQWLAHSRNLRLSVLEKTAEEAAWKSLVAFVERYGQDLFTQRFLNLGNLRALLHQGVDVWLRALEENDDREEELLLLDELGRGIDRAEAVKQLELVIEAIVENYSEYRDYNSTTTQSDRGELLYTLLDFLRLRVQYDRIAWHLRPVLLAHEVLVRRGRGPAAELWRRGLAGKTGEIADTLARRLAKLEQTYAMRVPTVADRIGERFLRALAIDRMRSMVGPAVREGQAGEAASAFRLLEQEVDELSQVPSGTGLDVPRWLAALEEEVERALAADSERPAEGPVSARQTPVSPEEFQQQVTDWELERM